MKANSKLKKKDLSKTIIPKEREDWISKCVYNTQQISIAIPRSVNECSRAIRILVRKKFVRVCSIKLSSRARA